MCGKGASGAAVAPDWLPPWRRLAGLPSRATFAFGASGARAGAMAEDGEGRAGGWAGLGWAVGRARQRAPTYGGGRRGGGKRGGDHLVGVAAVGEGAKEAGGSRQVWAERGSASAQLRS